jgi:molybdopterin-biosynthesis enzyme MoeA-like protein
MMAIGVIAGLLAFGGLSDMLGRRYVLLLSVAIGLLACAVFLIPGLPSMFLARFIQGIEIALMVSTGPATISERLESAGRADSGLAAPVTTIANLGGLGAGGLISALVVKILRHPFTTPYMAFAGLLLACGIMIAFSEQNRGKTLHIAFRIRLPHIPGQNRRGYFAAGAVGLSALAAFSIFASLGPSVLSSVFGISGITAGPAVYFLVMMFGAIGQLALIRLPSTWRKAIAVVLMAIGFGLTAVCTRWPNMVMFILGAMLLGLGSGTAFADAARTVISLADQRNAASAQAGFFIIAYLGMVIPIVALAALVDGIGVPAAFAVTGTALTAIAAAGLAVILQPRRQRTVDGADHSHSVRHEPRL